MSTLKINQVIRAPDGLLYRVAGFNENGVPICTQITEAVGCQSAHQQNSTSAKEYEKANVEKDKSVGAKGNDKKPVNKPHSYSEKEDSELMKNWLVFKPRKGTDKKDWEKIKDLVNPNLTALSIQRHMCLLMNKRAKANKIEDQASGEEPCEKIEKQEALDKCLDTWNDVHEGNHENVKKLGENIRKAAMEACGCKSTSPVTPKDREGRLQFMDLLGKREDRKDCQQELMKEHISLKKLNLEQLKTKEEEERQLKIRKIQLRD